MEQSDLKGVIPTAVNDEVAVFRGCTTSEMVMLIGISAAVWLPLTAIVGLMVGKFMMVFGFSLALMLGTVLVCAPILQAVKQGKPDGYYQQHIALWAARMGFAKAPFFVHDGTLSIERSELLVFMHRDLEKRERERVSNH